MGAIGKRLLFAVELLCMVGGLALAIAATARQIGEWGVLGWAISTVSSVHLLSARRTRTNAFRVGRPDPVLRVIVASVAVFCISIFVIAIVISRNVPQGPIGQVDAIVLFVLGLVGVASTALSIRWIWK